MTRILLPVLLAIFGLLGLMALVPIVVREMFHPRRRTQELDRWLADIEDWD